MEAARMGIFGRPPVVTIKCPNPEARKYEKMWQRKEYREFSPGEEVSAQFIQQAHLRPGDEVIDFGCGTGRAAMLMAVLRGVKVTMVDFVGNCLDEDVRNALTTQKHLLKFMQLDLEQPLPIAAKYGFCSDVMEHIPEDKVGIVMANILQAAQHVFFQISLIEDKCGELIGEQLHMTVKPFEWWMKLFRDNDVVVHWAQGVQTDTGRKAIAMFYVSAWSDVSEVMKKGRVNVPDEQLRANIAANVKRPIAQVRPHDRQDTEVMVLGGGPSLNEFWPEIIEKRKTGMPLITINGTYHQAIEHGLKPSAQVVVDAREFNARFVTPRVEDCKYFLASQCHPSVFDAAPPDQTVLFHSVINPKLAEFIDVARGDADWFPVPGGSTAMLRIPALFRMLGFWRFHVYGFDSCLMDGAHHAYSQPENDNERSFPVTCSSKDGGGSKTFWCTVWMASQAREFIDVVRMMGDEIQMEVYGNGLIAHIIRTGADAVDLEEAEAQPS